MWGPKPYRDCEYPPDSWLCTHQTIKVELQIKMFRSSREGLGGDWGAENDPTSNQNEDSSLLIRIEQLSFFWASFILGREVWVRSRHSLTRADCLYGYSIIENGVIIILFLINYWKWHNQITYFYFVIEKSLCYCYIIPNILLINRKVYFH